MAIIIINDKHCKIEDEDDFGFISKLDQELSFRIQGAEYSQAYKLGRWDGVKHILTSQLRFPYGLLQRVIDFYNRYDKAFTIKDDRSPKQPNQSIDIIPKLTSLDRNPYPYQLEALERVKEKDIGIIRAATGSGKSLLAALITAYFGKLTILYVIGNDLLYQTHKFFSAIFNQKIGIVGDGLCDIQDINIVSVWTVGKAFGIDAAVLDDIDSEKLVTQDKYTEIQSLINCTKVMIYDECHLAAAATFQEISKNITADHVYGMSASPWRDDGADLLIECILGPKIVDISASYLIERGFLARPIIKFITVPKHPEKLKKNYQTVYKRYIVENEVRNRLVVDNAIKLVNLGYQTLVLYTTITHGKLLYEEISKHVPCVLLSGKDSTETREAAKLKLERGEIKCIVASKIYDIGVDLPSLSGLVLAGGGKSSVRALQRIGRVIRKFKGKKQAAVVDFFDQAHFLKEHSLERKKIYSTEKEFKIIWPS